MSLVSLTTVETYCGASSGDTDLAIIHPAVETAIERHTHRTLSSTTYTNQVYDGTGTCRLYLKNYPITAITNISTQTAAGLTIQNEATDAHSALVNVESDKIQLKVIGGDSAHAWADLTFADYATMTLMADAIVAYGSDWTAEVADSDYDSTPTNILLPELGLEATSEISLSFPGTSQLQTVDRNAGIVYRDWGVWPLGIENIRASYTAGYVTSGDNENVPDDLVYLVCETCKIVYDRKTKSAEGLYRYDLGDVDRWYFEKVMESEPLLKAILTSYTRILL